MADDSDSEQDGGLIDTTPRTRIEHNYQVSRLHVDKGVTCLAVSKHNFLAIGFRDGSVIVVHAQPSRSNATPKRLAAPSGVRVCRIGWSPAGNLVGYYLQGQSELKLVGVELDGELPPPSLTIRFAAPIADFCFLCLVPAPGDGIARLVAATTQTEQQSASLYKIYAGKYEVEPLGPQPGVEFLSVAHVAASVLETNKGTPVDMWCTAGSARMKGKPTSNDKQKNN